MRSGDLLCEDTRRLAENAGIHLNISIPPPPERVRAVEVTIRCFQVLKKSPLAVIERARNGDRNAVLELVKMDRMFLHDSSTRDVITEAERRQDQRFLSQLSAAMRYQTPKLQKERFVCWSLLFLIFASGSEIPKHRDLQEWVDPNGAVFETPEAMDKFVQNCRKSFDHLESPSEN
jgi:hypothetical protein